MARLTKAQKEAQAAQSRWELYEEYYRTRPKHSDELDPFLEAEYARNNPSFSNVRGGVTTTEEEAPLAPLPSITSEDPWVRDVGLGIASSTLSNIAAPVLDMLDPDVNPSALEGRADVSPWSPSNLWANVVDTAVSHMANQERYARAMVGSVDEDVAGRMASPWGAVQEDRAARGVAIDTARAAVGLPTSEELRQTSGGFAGLPVNNMADAVRELGQTVGGLQSPELRSAMQNLETSRNEGLVATARQIASGEGMRAMLTGALPSSVPYAAFGWGAGRGLSLLGAGQRVAQVGAGTLTGFTVAQSTANDVYDNIINMTDDEAAASPVIARLLASNGGDLQAAKRSAANAARMSAVAQGVSNLGLYAMPGNVPEALGAGVRAGGRTTMQGRVGGALGREFLSEGAQGASEALAGNMGEVTAGTRDAQDIGRGLAGAALVEGLAGAPVAGGMTAVQSRQEFNQRADRLSNAADRLRALAEQRAIDRAEQERVEREEVAALAEAEREFLYGGGSVSQVDSGRTTESYEEWAQREADTAPVRQPDTIDDAEDFNRAPMGVTPSRSPVRFEDRRQPTAAAIRADNERLAQAMLAEDAAQEAFEADAAASEGARAAEVRDMDTRVAEARTMDAEASKKELAAARTSHTAARRKHLADVRDQNKALPADERATVIAEASRAWDLANPAPTAESVATTPAPARGRGRRAVPAQEAPQAPAVSPEELAAVGLTETDTAAPAAAEADVEEWLGRRMDAEGGAGRSPADVLDALAERVRKGTDSKALAQEQLLLNGKLSIVNATDMAQVHPDSAGAAGFYDGERMYINSEALPEGDVVGHVFNSILAHEADHGARLSDNADAKSRVSVWLGDAQKGRLIEQLETSNHPVAVATRQRLADRGITRDTDPALYEDEITAYAINSAMDIDNGQGWAPIRGLVSAARRKFKQFTGSENINLNDLGGYAQDVINALADSSAGISADTSGRSMIGGQTATGFAGAQDAGRTYRGAVDGKERFEFADNEAQITADNNTLADLKKGNTYPLRAILSHDMAYSNYPGFLERIVVQPMRGMDNTVSGNWDGRNISVGTDLITLAEAGDTEPLRLTLLHEAQHAIQQREGFVDGANKRDMIPADIRNDFDLAKDRFEGFISNFPLEDAVASLSQEGAQKWRSLLGPDAVEQRAGTIAFMAHNMADMSSSQYVKNAARRYGEVRGFLGDSRAAYMEAENAAFQRYLRNYGEGEARNTELRSDLTQEQIDADRDAGFTPEDTMGQQDGVTVDQMVDESPMGRFRAGRAMTLDSGSTAEADVTATPGAFSPQSTSQRSWNVVKDALTWHGREGKEVARLVEESQGYRDKFYALAQSTAHLTRRASDLQASKWAKEKGITKDEALSQVDEMVSNTMDIIRRLPDPATRDKALTNWVNKYPDMQPVADGVRHINALTMQLIHERMADPTPLTEDERVLYNYLHKNRGGYLTNTYALFQGKAGERWAERVATGFDEGLSALADNLSIPEAVRDEYRIYKNALDYVIANDVAVSDPEMLSAMSLDDVRRTHDLWAPVNDRALDVQRSMEAAGDYTPELLKEELAQRVMEYVEQAQGTEEGQRMIQDLGKGVVNELLRLAPLSGPAKRYARAAGIKDDVLQHRVPLDPALQALYGKVESVPALILTTLTQQAETASRMQLFNRMRNEGYGDMVVSASDRAANPSEYGRHTVQLGETFGAVRGLYTTPEIATALDDYHDSFTTMLEDVAKISDNPWVDTAVRNLANKDSLLGKASGTYKWSQIVTEPSMLLVNFAGSMATPMLAGGVKPSNLTRSAKVAVRSILNTLDPSGRVHDATMTTDDLLAVESGMLDNIVLSDLRGEPRKMVQQMLNEMNSVSTIGEMQNIAAKWARKGSRGIQAWTEFFSSADAWVRFGVALERIDYLTAYHKANGDSMTNQQIVRDAAEFAKNATLTPSRTPGLVQGLERKGGTMFGRYMVNVPRVLFMSGKHLVDSINMARDAKTPEARMIAGKDAIRKTAGISATIYASLEGLRMLAEAGMDDEEKERIEHARKFAYGEAEVGDLIPAGKSGDGHDMYLLASRADQLGPSLDGIRALRHADNPEEMAEALWANARDKVIMAAVLPQLIKNAATVFSDPSEVDVRYKKSTIEKMFPEEANAFRRVTDSVASAFNLRNGYNIAEAALETASMAMPRGIATQWEAVNPSIAEPTENEAVAAVAGTLQALGHRLVVIKPEAAMSRAAYGYRDTVKDGTGKVRDALLAEGPAAAFSTYTREAEKERQDAVQLSEMYTAALGMGHSPREVKAWLKNAGLDNTTIANIARGTVDVEADDWARRYSRIFSEKSAEQPPRGASTEEVARWKAEAKEVKRRLKVLGLEENK